VQLAGKIAGPNFIEVFQVKSLNTDPSCNGQKFDMALYNKTLELMNGKYRHLFE
jgi:molecular chaperone DnaK (HSP70)